MKTKNQFDFRFRGWVNLVFVGKHLTIKLPKIIIFYLVIYLSFLVIEKKIISIACKRSNVTFLGNRLRCTRLNSCPIFCLLRNKIWNYNKLINLDRVWDFISNGTLVWVEEKTLLEEYGMNSLVISLSWKILVYASRVFFYCLSEKVLP